MDLGGITAPRLVSGSPQVQTLMNKIVLPIFFIPPPLPFLSKNGTQLAGEIAFFFRPLDVSVTPPLWCVSRCWERLGFSAVKTSGRSFFCGGQVM